MGKADGFLTVRRATDQLESTRQRIRHFHEFTRPLSLPQWQDQGARCMNCGIPFCHSGCPLGNLIPDFNDAVYRGQWQKASELLHQTNNFPEFTGRLCPAPCEEACVLNISEQPVAIENIEKTVADQAREHGWHKPVRGSVRTGKKVAIVGSGPAGLAAAEQLNSVGHDVTVFEKAAKPGGLLRYGIPDFKLEKQLIDKRVMLMEAAGVKFECGFEVGQKISAIDLQQAFDAVVLCAGASQKRELDVVGRRAAGVMQAMDYLCHNNQVLSGEVDLKSSHCAKDKKVIVIGGGDTGSDCVGTALRQGASSVLNFEIMPKPPAERSVAEPWPFWPMRLRTSSSHQEGGERHWSLATQSFVSDAKGRLTGLVTVEVEWCKDQGTLAPVMLPDTQKEWSCDLVLLAMGFSGADQKLAKSFGCELSARQLFMAGDSDYRLNDHGLFASGDCRRGQSLIVWAISEGRELAYQVDCYLMGHSHLPRKGQGDLPGPA
ncbi:glutamate synthase subunit beta [Marinicella sediminis]|uniref:Glutamate synthase subunit beta n=1 Tax=Marinicella sediminis TaxID=1792834 RepID=A0ABV7JJU7_9GAMM|nr:glutamate synthase subunit beta [Marinicella sediminis]